MVPACPSPAAAGLLILLIGISFNSCCKHNHSPKTPVMVKLIALTTHQSNLAGIPLYSDVKTKWTMYIVAAKSRHFLALLMMKRRATAARKALQKVAMATVHPGKDLKFSNFHLSKLCGLKLGM